MIKQPNKNLVLIIPDSLPEPADGEIIIPDTAKDKIIKSQNRGKVVLVGELCTWAKKDDYIAFYRAAATDISEDGIDYVLIHEAHCLAKIVKK